MRGFLFFVVGLEHSAVDRTIDFLCSLILLNYGLCSFVGTFNLCWTKFLFFFVGTLNLLD
jgi:hypothetical protein